MKARSFNISKEMVWAAFKAVKANKGAPGVDGQSIEDPFCGWRFQSEMAV